MASGGRGRPEYQSIRDVYIDGMGVLVEPDARGAAANHFQNAPTVIAMTGLIESQLQRV